jgi:hypothetical protein
MANNEGVDIIIKATDQYTKTINNITASNELFGKSVKNIEKEIAALQTYMVKLVTSGISPASGAIKLLQTNLDQLKNSLVQTQNATNSTTTVLNSNADSIKNSNKQYMALALVLQDLPYGFRGIQNNLPALFGSIATGTGIAYVAFSGLVAVITALDMGIIKFGKSVKLTTDFSKDAASTFANETIKLESLYTVSTNVNASMEDRLQAAKTLKSEYPDLLSLYTAEQITLGEAATAYRVLTDTIWQYAQAKAAEKSLEELAVKQNELNVKRVKAQADQKERDIKGLKTVNYLMYNNLTLTEQFNKFINDLPANGAFGPIVNSLQAMQKSSDVLYDIEQQQTAINDEVSIYKGIVNENINAEDRLAKFKANEFAKEQERLKKIQEAEKKKSDKILINQEKENKKLAAFAAKRVAQAGGDIQRIEEPIIDPKAQAKAFDDKMAFDKKMSKGRVDLLKQQYQLEVSEAQGSFDKIKLAETNMRNALNQGFMDGTIKLSEYLDAIFELRKKSNETVTSESKAAMQDIVQMGIGIMNALGPALDLLLEKGASIGEVLSKAFTDIIKKLVKVAIAAAIAVAVISLLPGMQGKIAQAGGALKYFGNLVGAGMGLGADLFSPTAKGGIFGGPSYRLVGEYPGAANNPEIVAPLDKLQSMIGGSGGGTLEARISGNDLLILMNKANRNNQSTF